MCPRETVDHGRHRAWQNRCQCEPIGYKNRNPRTFARGRSGRRPVGGLCPGKTDHACNRGLARARRGGGSPILSVHLPLWLRLVACRADQPVSDPRVADTLQRVRRVRGRLSHGCGQGHRGRPLVCRRLLQLCPVALHASTGLLFAPDPEETRDLPRTRQLADEHFLEHPICDQQDDEQAAQHFAEAGEIEASLSDQCEEHGLVQKSLIHRFSAASCWAHAGNFYQAITICDELLARELPQRFRRDIEDFAKTLRSRRARLYAQLTLVGANE